MNKSYVWILAAILAGVGTLLFLYKWLVLGFPLREQQEIPAWTVETTIRFDSGPAIPAASTSCAQPLRRKS